MSDLHAGAEEILRSALGDLVDTGQVRTEVLLEIASDVAALSARAAAGDPVDHEIGLARATIRDLARAASVDAQSRLERVAMSLLDFGIAVARRAVVP